jgi:formylglycine-generating enzyme required for sulfatase activity
VREVVEKLATERLLVMAPGTGSAEAEETVEVAHEALLRGWDTLRAWLDGQREFLLWRKRFGEMVAAWRAGEHREDALATGVFLSEGERWQRERGEALSPEEREYIAASLARRQREEAEREARRQRELEQARQLAHEAEARQAAEAQRAQEAEARARAQRRAKRVALAGLAVLFVVASGLFYAAGGVGLLARGSARRALDQEIKWAPIPAPAKGQFQMGCVREDRECFDNEKPRQPVELRRSFGMMAHEATVTQFGRFSDATGAPVVRWLRPWDVFQGTQPDWNKENHPAVNVSWFEAAAFCAFLGGRLPTEAEWEYAARDGNPDTIYPWGNDYSQDRANGAGTGGGDRWDHTAPVGSFPTNGFGLHDMVGNVWEWTASVYRDYPYRGEKPGDRESREARVIRGGSWFSGPGGLRVSVRDGFQPTGRDASVGFRCARDVSS